MNLKSCLRTLQIALVSCATATALASEPVTIDNFRRAESDHYFKTYVDRGCFGKLCSDRAASLVSSSSWRSSARR